MVTRYAVSSRWNKRTRRRRRRPAVATIQDLSLSLSTSLSLSSTLQRYTLHKRMLPIILVFQIVIHLG